MKRSLNTFLLQVSAAGFVYTPADCLLSRSSLDGEFLLLFHLFHVNHPRKQVLHGCLQTLSKTTTKDRTRKTHPLQYDIPSNRTQYCKMTLFPRTVSEWNNLPADAACAPSLATFQVRGAQLWIKSRKSEKRAAYNVFASSASTSKVQKTKRQLWIDLSFFYIFHRCGACSHSVNRLKKMGVSYATEKPIPPPLTPSSQPHPLNPNPVVIRLSHHYLISVWTQDFNSSLVYDHTQTQETGLENSSMYMNHHTQTLDIRLETSSTHLNV